MKNIFATFAALASTALGLAATTATLTPSSTYLAPGGGNITLTADIAGYPSDTTALGLIVALPAASGGATTSTFAGSVGVNEQTDGTGTGGHFSYPTATAVDASGNVYVTETDRVRKITSGGVMTTLATGFSNATGVAIDSGGYVFVADQGSNQIKKITPGGAVSVFAGSGSTGAAEGTGTGAKFAGPTGVAVDSGGNVYVADAGNCKIRKITSSGVVTTLAGTGYAGHVDATGTAASFNAPYGLAVDAVGNVYVADGNNTIIRKITSDGVVTTLAGTSGVAGTTDATGAGAQFMYPYGVAVDGSGNVYVADTQNHAIRKITSSGVVTTVAGTKGTSGSSDGTNARFNRPNGICVDSSGTLYIADTFNRTVRKIGFAAWSYVSGTNEPDVKPVTGQFGPLEWAYSTKPPSSPVSFTFTVAYPAGLSGNATVSSQVIVRNGGDPLYVTPADVGMTTTAAVPAIINAATAGGTYGTAFSLSITATSDVTISSYGATGLPTGLSVNSSTGNITGTPAAAGPFSVTLSATNPSGAGTKELSLTIAKATATVALSGLAATYDGTPKSATATTTPSGLTSALTYEGSATAPTNAGSYAVVATISDANYQGSASNTLVVAKATPSITWATPAAITYGVALSSTQLSASTAPAGAFVYTPAAGAFLNAGNGQTLSVAFTPTDTSNYNSASGSVSIDVAKATLGVSPIAAQRTYGAANPTFAPAYSGFVRGESAAALTGAPTLSTAAGASSSVNSYAVTAAVGTLGAANYSFAFSDGTLSVDKATLTVKADDKNTFIGLSLPTFTATITGFVNDENASVLTGSPSLSSAASAGSPVGTYAITAALGDLAADNYDFAFQAGSLEILLGSHSADTNRDWRISLFELTRVIDIYNTSSSDVRTGAYHTQADTEDGYAPGAGSITGWHHMADTDCDGQISLLELTRVIQLFNVREGNVRTGAYHLDPDAEDGFAPGS